MDGRLGGYGASVQRGHRLHVRACLFHYLKESLVYLLAFVGVKMLLSHHYHIPTEYSLAFIIGILAVGVLASIFGKHATATKALSHAKPPEPAPQEP